MEAAPAPQGAALTRSGGPVEELKSLIVKVYLTSKASLLILGPPGAGKSSAVMQAGEILAELMGRNLVIYDDDMGRKILEDPSRYFVVVDIRLTEVEPSDLIGVPKSDGDYVMYKPLLWSRVMNKVPGIVFLDELTNVQDDTVLAAAYKILLDRRVGFVKLGDGVMVVAAGNTPEHSSIARELPAPQVNRAVVLEMNWENSSESVGYWLSYLGRRVAEEPLHTKDDLKKFREVADIVGKWRAAKAPGKLYGVMSAFLALSMKLVTKPANAALMENFATPRTWEMLYWTLTDEYDLIWTPEEQRAICVGLLGKDVGLSFWSWLRRPLPNIEHLLENPEQLASMKAEDVVYIAAMFGLYLQKELDRAGDAKKRKIVEFLKALVKAAGKEAMLVVQATIGTTIEEKAERLVKLVRMAPELGTVYLDIHKAYLGMVGGRGS